MRIRIPYIILALVMSLSITACSNQRGTELTPVQIDYDNAEVSYLGPEGTYTEAACEQFFEGKGKYVPYGTVNDAVQALVDGDSNYAVIPQENTIGGAVIDYVDTLISQTGVSVVGEVELPIDQNILVKPDAYLTDIKTVYSHKQGLTQGKEWLEQNLPDAEIIEVSSTAEGARLVSEGDDNTCAAIASSGAADVYGLKILAANIQNNDKNKTRFYVLSTEEPGTTEEDRTAFIISGSATDLPELMDDMDDMQLVTIHDRPRKTELGEYYYLIECTECSFDEYNKLTQNSPFEFRYLGSFDVK